MDGKTISEIDYGTTEQTLQKMIRDPNYLKDGYKIFSAYETYKNFYANLCHIIFNNKEPKIIKLAASVLRTFLTKNWSDGNYISTDEKLVKYINLEYSKYSTYKHSPQ
jgi:hypothetical protein